MTDGPLIPQANPGASYAAQEAAIDAAIHEVLESGRYILGEPVAKFEQEFAAYLGAKHGVGVASGTDAIELALRALEIGAGQAVIAPSHTAVATVAAIEQAGARPILIDVDPKTYTITAGAIEAVVRDRRELEGCRIAAVIPVHLYGHPADMPAILDVARRHGLRVIEDCAQSHGRGSAMTGRERSETWRPSASIRRRISVLSATAGWSRPTIAELQQRLVALREYGWQQRYVSALAGLNSRLDSLQAAILSVKLPRLDADNDRRRAIAAPLLGRPGDAWPRAADVGSRRRAGLSSVRDPDTRPG